ncbi:hypothetical protein FQR65_LT17679 [Abscondita terminalis]|nr:hypothetical protein FQR65_LT17679 [Abscondita terminalis]
MVNPVPIDIKEVIKRKEERAWLILLMFEKCSARNRSSNNLARILQRIRQIIADNVRLYESANEINTNQVNEAKRNLDRISVIVSTATYNQISDGINALLSLKRQQEHNRQSYSSHRTNDLRKGQPAVLLDADLTFLYNEGCNARRIAAQLGCSQSTVYKKLYEKNMPMRLRYSQISDEDLESNITEIHNEYPNAGQVMMQSYLKAAGINVPRIEFEQSLVELILWELLLDGVDL